MPWSQIPGRNPETFAFYQKLANLKKTKKALQEGGMKFLYVKDQIFSLARFYDEEIYVAVMSTDDKKQCIELPLSVLGIQKFTKQEDIFGNKLKYEVMDGNGILLEVEPHQAFLMDCSI